MFQRAKLGETSTAGRRDHQAARMLPTMQWVIAESALGIAVRGLAKCACAKTAPNPEFCMPTSIEVVRATLPEPDTQPEST